MTVAVANSRQVTQWDRARRRYEKLCARIALLRQRLNYARLLADFAAERGTTVKVSSPTWWADATRALELLDEARYKLGLAMSAAESGELAIRSTEDGKDLDIIAPEDLASKWKPYKLNAGDVPPFESFGIAPLIVVGIVAIVVVGGVLTVMAIADLYAEKVDKEIAVANRQAEIHFCSDPNSATCTAWQQRQKSAPVRETKSAIDYLLGKGAGKKLAGGAALVLGIGALIWLFKD